jgi:antitoxin ChpS
MMHTTNLRKVGGTVMLAIPPDLLDLLGWRAGTKVGMAVESGRLVIKPQRRPRYTLEELLAQCDPNALLRESDDEWLGGEAVGRELI